MLVMGDINECHAQVVMKLSDFRTERLTQVDIEVGQWLVK